MDILDTKNHRLGKTPDGDSSKVTYTISECFDIEHLTVAIVAT